MLSLHKIDTMTTNDSHIEMAKIQKAIEEHLGIHNIVFDYIAEGGNIRLNLITLSPRHNQSFLFRSEIGIDKLDALKKMQQYVFSYKEQENSYTVQWIITGKSELHTSYFRAKNIYDALDKLYFGREPNSLTVFSVVMNPIA